MRNRRIERISKKLTSKEMDEKVGNLVRLGIVETELRNDEPFYRVSEEFGERWVNVAFSLLKKRKAMPRMVEATIGTLLSFKPMTLDELHVYINIIGAFQPKLLAETLVSVG